MSTADDIFAIQRAYPRIWHACHVRHRRRSGGTASQRQVEILVHIEPDRPASPGQLSRHLGIAASTLSEALEEMEGLGLLERRRSDRDRRAVAIHLTELGKRAISADSALDSRRVRALLARLDPEERRTAVAGLALLGRAAAGLANGDEP